MSRAKKIRNKLPRPLYFEGPKGVVLKAETRVRTGTSDWEYEGLGKFSCGVMSFSMREAHVKNSYKIIAPSAGIKSFNEV